MNHFLISHYLQEPKEFNIREKKRKTEKLLNTKQGKWHPVLCPLFKRNVWWLMMLILTREMFDSCRNTSFDRCPLTPMLLSSLSGWKWWTPWLSEEKLHQLFISFWVHANSLQPYLTLCDPMDPTRLLCPRDSPGKNTGVGCYALL